MDDLAKKALGVVGTIGKKAGGGLLEEVKKTAKSAGTQVGLENAIEHEKGEQPIAQQAETAPALSGEETANSANEDFINSLYAPSAPVEQQPVKQEGSNAENPTQKLFERLIEENPGKSQEEIQAMVSDYIQQHKETYFEPLVNRPQQEEENTADKMEREKKEEDDKKMELEEKNQQKVAAPAGKNSVEQERKLGG